MHEALGLGAAVQPRHHDVPHDRIRKRLALAVDGNSRHSMKSVKQFPAERSPHVEALPLTATPSQVPDYRDTAVSYNTNYEGLWVVTWLKRSVSLPRS